MLLQKLLQNSQENVKSAALLKQSCVTYTFSENFQKFIASLKKQFFEKQNYAKFMIRADKTEEDPRGTCHGFIIAVLLVIHKN